jgi:glycine dehydrogenase subunit 2
MLQKLLFEKSVPGRSSCQLPCADVPEKPLTDMLPESVLRSVEPGLPEIAEIDLVRHFTNLSKLNTGVDDSFYPLGSCTMKYNPKINETLAALDGFASIHPYQPDDSAQGMLQIMWELGEYLKEVTGLPGVTLQPAAGAHGEFAGIKVIRAFHKHAGNPRHKILIPDSAHGTNPASVVFCGYQPVQVKSDANGNVDLEDLRSKADADTAALMLTIPNTLGLFDPNLGEIAKILHNVGAFLYMDGANLNSIMGIVRPAEAGVDVMHINLHKTFSTPHGGGGPGSGPITVCEKLEPFLPVPMVMRKGNFFWMEYHRPLSMGRVKAFSGNVGVAVKAYVYTRMLGGEGLRHASEMAVLNANYIMARLKKYYRQPYERLCMHECVLTGEWQMKKNGVRTLDIAKRLLDHGYHPPTIYFPLIVHESIMIEPTETESKDTLDGFIDVMITIAGEADTNPDIVKTAPHSRPVRRLDEVKAAKDLILRWQPAQPAVPAAAPQN